MYFCSRVLWCVALLWSAVYCTIRYHMVTVSYGYHTLPYGHLANIIVLYTLLIYICTHTHTHTTCLGGIMSLCAGYWDAGSYWFNFGDTQLEATSASPFHTSRIMVQLPSVLKGQREEAHCRPGPFEAEWTLVRTLHSQTFANCSHDKLCRWGRASLTWMSSFLNLLARACKTIQRPGPGHFEVCST